MEVSVSEITSLLPLNIFPLPILLKSKTMKSRWAPEPDLFMEDLENILEKVQLTQFSHRFLWFATR